MPLRRSSFYAAPIVVFVALMLVGFFQMRLFHEFDVGTAGAFQRSECGRFFRLDTRNHCPRFDNVGAPQMLTACWQEVFAQSVKSLEIQPKQV